MQTLIMKKIDDDTIVHDLFEEQMDWKETSNVIDVFRYGDNDYGYTMDKINEMIVTHPHRYSIRK